MFIISILTLVCSLLLGYQSLALFGITNLFSLGLISNSYLIMLNIVVLKWSPILSFLLAGVGLCGVLFLHKDEEQSRFIILMFAVAIFTTLVSIL